MRRQPFSVPERFTAADALRIAMGVLMIPLGVVILLRTLSIAVTLPGILIGAAFIGFGVHRLWIGWHGYRLYRQHREAAR